MNRMNIKTCLIILTVCASLHLSAQNSNEAGIKVPEAIDMGGSVLWASFNLYAEQPTDVGIYCGWGDPTGDLKFQADDPNMENYIDTEACLAMYGGLEPGYRISGSDIDVVHRHLKNGWQMPEKYHFEELHDCKWELTRIDGTLGYKVTAKNGNSIFLPAWNNNMGKENGIDVAYGCYWTANHCSISTDEGELGSYYFGFDMAPSWLESEDYDIEPMMVAPRWAQLMIRPVKPK